MLKMRFLLITLLTSTFAMAADGAMGAAIGAGMVVIGAGVGIGMFASAAAHATARQPEAAGDIRFASLPIRRCRNYRIGCMHFSGSTLVGNNNND